jgi:hypothetical protein
LYKVVKRQNNANENPEGEEKHIRTRQSMETSTIEMRRWRIGGEGGGGNID